ncbi:TolC family protein [Rhodovulum adriaticum]|uniref:Outer membrane protein TolC n=1 Tax=Rhodovulum adriaticum TaxID=35804 RepID=A0A4R2NZU9_RHOAD|nr:TolC family protein [Rhodovulum adriaticum]MBK1634143.1 hypothetical protein [Rhodovulum adriaticum]TCP27308.1 outer membrane protein TolC [Rhodovulum adriaticum]
MSRATTAGRTRRAATWGVVALVLVLGGCTASPDLSALEAEFDAPPEQRAVRVSAAVAETGFGRQVAAAVSSSPRLNAANADLRAARAQEDGDRRAFMPRFSLGATLGTGVGGGNTGLSPLLQVLQLVYDGGASASIRIAARARVFESRGARLEVASALALEAVEAWHGLIAAGDLYRLARQNEAVHRKLYTQVQDRAEAGAGTQSDLLTARARLADATSRRVEALSRQDRAQAIFREVFGHAPGDLAVPPAAPTLPRLADAELIASSPRIRGLEARVKAAEADLAATRATWFPRVQLQGTAERSAGGGTDSDLDMLLDFEPGAPGQKAAAIRASEARLAALQAERESLSREIRRALDVVRSDQRAGAARLQAARASVAANRATVDAAQEQFSIGRRSLIGLLDAQRDLYDASETLIAARQELALSGYAALALTGDILDAFAITLPAGAEDAEQPVQAAQAPATEDPPT